MIPKIRHSNATFTCWKIWHTLNRSICVSKLRTHRKFSAISSVWCLKLSGKLRSQPTDDPTFKSKPSIYSDEHSTKVKSFMLDILHPLITESDNVSMQLLDIILINIVEPQKMTRKNAYNLAKDLIIKTADTLEQYIQNVSCVLITYYKSDGNWQIWLVCLQNALVLQSSVGDGQNRQGVCNHRKSLRSHLWIEYNIAENFTVRSATTWVQTKGVTGSRTTK